MNNDVDIVIVGAGVIGLAIAYELSKSFNDIYVVEKNLKLGEETSARSSEVIHSGIYYPLNSLKTKLCVEGGNKLIYKFCKEHNISFNNCGKLVVASTKNQIEDLKKIKNQGKKNGVTGIEEISSNEITQIEPNIYAEHALFIPSSGVVDSCGFMLELEKISKENGVNFVYNSEVLKIDKSDIGYNICVNDNNSGNYNFSSRVLINCAGLHADKVSSLVGINDKSYELSYCKGEYFSIGNRKNSLVKRLIYPVPEKNLKGLGVHTTIDINGGLKLGPNAYYLKTII